MQSVHTQQVLNDEPLAEGGAKLTRLLAGASVGHAVGSATRQVAVDGVHGQRDVGAE